MNRLILLFVLSSVGGIVIISGAFVSGIIVGKYMDTSHNTKLPLYEMVMSHNKRFSNHIIYGKIISVKGNILSIQYDNTTSFVYLSTNTRVLKNNQIVDKNKLVTGENVTVIGIPSDDNSSIRAIRIDING